MVASGDLVALHPERLVERPKAGRRAQPAGPIVPERPGQPPGRVGPGIHDAGDGLTLLIVVRRRVVLIRTGPAQDRRDIWTGIFWRPCHRAVDLLAQNEERVGAFVVLVPESGAMAGEDPGYRQ